MAVLASLMGSFYAFEISKDLSNPEIPSTSNILGLCVMASIAFAAIGLGIRFLLFAWSGRSRQSHGWLRPIFLGIGSFFPGFCVFRPSDYSVSKPHLAAR
jgi:hypothetical protein